MSKRRFRTGDEVVVIAGNDRGRTGKVLRFMKERVVVEGCNVRKKHMKKSQENQQGQILDIECPIHISNVMPFADGKGRRLKADFNSKGEKGIYYLEKKKRVDFRPKKNEKKK